MIFKWLRDPRYVPDPEMAVGDLASETSCFLPVEIVAQPLSQERALATDPVSMQSTIEIDIAGGHRLRIIGCNDPEALARLIGGLSV